MPLSLREALLLAIEIVPRDLGRFVELEGPHADRDPRCVIRLGSAVGWVLASGEDWDAALIDLARTARRGDLTLPLEAAQAFLRRELARIHELARQHEEPHR